ncbi:DUF1801 domain-containing protein [Microbacterium capsulatum]|uniref:DUF1801 domain-containing protein n=1 Tax=Microbacterium capsulatum TaxID=3041921 RepID=A0ABU0XIH2_9MICO|nr:DUF1801 domain-containing protein [Microbacterium sp. ASV81]MDQ4214928.1 DUF1801 domain-containing protein [Microbacterium sp. ASV81]
MVGEHNPDVDAWFERYDNPQKPLVMAVRDAILAVDDRVTECVKWQAPTFVFQGNIASFFPKARNHVSLMFHAGAALDDGSGFLEGDGATARSAKFVSEADLAAKLPALQAVVRAWIASKGG